LLNAYKHIVYPLYPSVNSYFSSLQQKSVFNFGKWNLMN